MFIYRKLTGEGSYVDLDSGKEIKPTESKKLVESQAEQPDDYNELRDLQLKRKLLEGEAPTDYETIVRLGK